MEQWAKKIYRRCKDSSKARSIDFDLSRDDFEKLVNDSQGRCAITGILFDFDTRETGSRAHPFKPSLDRIDNRKGYVVGNIRLVCIAVNFAFNEWGEKVFDRIAKAYLGQASTTEDAWRKKRGTSKTLTGITRHSHQNGKVVYRARLRTKDHDIYIGTFHDEMSAYEARERVIEDVNRDGV